MVVNGFPGPYRRTMPIAAVAQKDDGLGGEWRLYMHDDHTAELWHRPAGGAMQILLGRQMLGLVRKAMVERGIGEDGWCPA